jgi:hypothetical protein
MLDPKQSHPCISDLTFDAWVGGEIEATQEEQLNAHLADCVRCTRRRALLSAAHAAFLERAPSWQDFHARLAQDAAPRAPRRWAVAGGIALAACALLAIVAERAPLAVRSKGGARIAAYVKHGEHVGLAIDGDTVEAGDLLRFTYSSDAPTYFALLSWDSQTATKYFPAGDVTVRVPAGHEVALDFSVELDGAPGAERVHALFCDQPQPVEPLRALLQARGQIPPLPHCSIDVLTLTKRNVVK